LTRPSTLVRRPGGGDLEFFHRLVAEGYALRYEPAAMVYHLHRRDDCGLRRQIYHNGRSFGAYLLAVGRNYPRRRVAVLRFASRWWLWDWLLKRLLKGVFKRDRLTRDLAVTELRGACTAVSAYWRSRKLARRLEVDR
jgi:hypothetical protein